MTQSGDRLGSFLVRSPLGRGGMGEVWRAEDERLGREVALKLLPDDLAADPERRARFEREARLLAALNHPNIATLYGFEHVDGRHVLVMELVEGEDLSRRIARGPIPVEETIAVARQIAEALEAAHERGIVHRDLKPANIKLRPDGTVKVLDFGLARAWEADSAEPSSSISPTMTKHATVEGAILGTAAYMSPEQARGRRVDRRADIWAFGTVLWEMLTGRRLFDGETVADILAGLLVEEPEWTDLPPAIPPSLRRLLRRCLTRDLRQRQQHMGDARLELDDGLEEALRRPGEPSPGPLRPSGPALKEFRLTTGVCRRIDRGSLDPAMIGDHLEYLDNETPSDTLVLYLPGMGLGHGTFAEVLSRSPHRGVAVTLYGFEKNRQHRIPLPMAAHLEVLGALLDHLMHAIEPARVVLAGFSSGADMVQRMVADGHVDPGRLDGILALGPNLDLDTCFFSARVAGIPGDHPDRILDVTQGLMAEAGTAEAWLRMNPYLSEILHNFHDDIRALRVHARDIVAPFARQGNRSAAGWYRAIKSLNLEVRLVFSSSEEDQEPLRKLLLANLENGVMGPDFDDADIVTEPDSDHLSLMAPPVIERHLAHLLEALPAS